MGISPESFSHIQRTLRSVQEFVSRVHKQNNRWPGGGALEKDVTQATRLLKEAQTGLIETADAIGHKRIDMDLQALPGSTGQYDRGLKGKRTRGECVESFYNPIGALYYEISIVAHAADSNSAFRGGMSR
jgi:hypothetical protein